MASEPTTPSTGTDLQSENAALRARVKSLELEVHELRSSTVEMVAQAQETLYWFERWGVDFNALMSRPQAEQLRKVVRAVRGVYRRLVHVKRGIDYRLGR